MPRRSRPPQGEIQPAASTEGCISPAIQDLDQPGMCTAWRIQRGIDKVAGALLGFSTSQGPWSSSNKPSLAAGKLKHRTTSTERRGLELQLSKSGSQKLTVRFRPHCGLGAFMRWNGSKLDDITKTRLTARGPGTVSRPWKPMSQFGSSPYIASRSLKGKDIRGTGGGALIFAQATPFPPVAPNTSPVRKLPS